MGHTDTCPNCGRECDSYDGALGKAAFKCDECEIRWARDHDGYLLWQEVPT